MIHDQYVSILEKNRAKIDNKAKMRKEEEFKMKEKYGQSYGSKRKEPNPNSQKNKFHY